MRNIPRPLSFELGPSPALAALLALDRETSARTTPLSRALRRAVEQETRRLQEPLAMIESCLDWLEKLGVARAAGSGRTPVARKPGTRNGRGARAHDAGAPAEPAYARAARVALDLTRLASRVAAEDGDPRGPWHATAFALRTLLRAASDGSLVIPREVRVGARGSDVAAARALLEQLLLQAGYEPRSAKRGATATAAETAGRAKTAAKTGEKTGAKTATSAPTRPEKPRATAAASTAKARPAPESERAKNANKTRRSRGPATGFGGLPDDAQPETRDGAPLGPRGISLDAEYFLEQAEISNWPCVATDLERGRKRALVRLHPDRMGDSATALFQRATRGYAELVRRLGDAKPATAAATATTTASVASAPGAAAPANTNASASASASTTSAPSKPANAAPKPVSRGTATTPTTSTTATPRASPPATALRASPVGEWPPREARTA